MGECKEFQFGLVCLIMAALTGLAGFAVIYHFATSQRPIEQFAIVIDAGSTQTRSSLYMIDVNVDKLIDWTSEDGPRDEEAAHELSKMIEAKQVSSCVNGGPLAAIQSEVEARKLVHHCVKKFARHIRKLDFINSENLDEAQIKSLDLDSEPAVNSLDVDEVAERLALLDHRVNTITFMHLGATAGMRALNLINQTRAQEKLGWIRAAISESNQHLELGPHINEGFVDIISGSEEAAFGWLSVNFVCDRLKATHRYEVNKFGPIPINVTTRNLLYEVEGLLGTPMDEDQFPLSVGTVELGGASSQIAYQVPQTWPQTYINRNLSMEAKSLNLFNEKYNLATQSDLCLGMSQATLRLKFVLLRDFFESSEPQLGENLLVKIVNPCFQNGSITNLTSSDVNDIFKAPCLASDESDSGGKQFKLAIGNASNQKTKYQFIGTGNTEQCNALLSKLLNSSECKKYFSLCPKEAGSNTKAPANMSFVTISGYNKALQILNLNKSPIYSDPTDTEKVKLDDLIGEKLGGYSISFSEFVDESKKFCAIDAESLTQKFPNLHKAYQTINCMQLVYIKKLLVEYYQFDPITSWHQLKFLLFPVAPKPLSKHDDKNDIGWTLGLLLNETSYQMSGDGSGDQEGSLYRRVFYHNGASLVFVMRTTIFLMLACVLVALSLIVVAGFAVKNRFKARSSYIDHSQDI